MKGRKPIPSALKIITGKPGRLRPTKKEPVPHGDLLTPPEWFTPSQKEGWNYAIANSPQGLLRRLDRSILVAWVVAEDMHRQATMKIAELGMVVEAPKTKLMIQSAYLPIVNRQMQLMLRAAAELGFSPSSRARIYYTPAGDQSRTDPAERFFEDVG